MVKFKVGDRVKRSLDVKLADIYTHGTVLTVEEGHDNQNRKQQAYRILFDSNKDGVLNTFTNQMQPCKGIVFLESELEKE